MPINPPGDVTGVRKYAELARQRPGAVFEILRPHFRGRFSLQVLSTFGDRAQMIWKVLVKKGYINEDGEIQPEFNNITEKDFNLDRTLEQDEVLDAFEEMGPTIWQALVDCEYVNAKGTILKSRPVLSVPETKLLYRQLAMFNRERPLALRIVGNRVELSVGGQEYAATGAYFRFEDEELLIPGLGIIFATHYGDTCSVKQALAAMDRGAADYEITIKVDTALAAEIGKNLVIGDNMGPSYGVPIVQPPSLLDHPIDPADFDSLPVEVRAAAATPDEIAKVPEYVPADEMPPVVASIVPGRKYPEEKAANPDAVFEIVTASPKVISMEDLSGLNGKATVVWGALIRRGIIDKEGRVVGVIGERREDFQLSTSLLPGLFTRLEERGEEIKQALIDSGFMDAEYNVQRPQYRLTREEQGKAFDILTAKKEKGRMALRVLGQRFELAIFGREFVSDYGRLAQDEYVYLVPQNGLFLNGARVKGSAIEVVGYRRGEQCLIAEALRQVEAGHPDYSLEVRIKGLLVNELGKEIHFMGRSNV